MKFIVVPLLCMMLIVNTMAYSNTNGVYEYENKNKVVTFNDSCTLTVEQQQMVADRLVYGDSGIQTYAWCWLLGHELTYNTVSVVTHKKSATSPRCFEELYNVATCANCDHMEEELLSATYIVCCD